MTADTDRMIAERAQTDEFIRDAAKHPGSGDDGLFVSNEVMRKGLEAKRRKGIPVYSGFVAYFPDAILAVAELSRIGNDQHNPGQPLHWSREKSSDHLDCLARHMIDDARGKSIDTDNVLHKTKVAWRAMADLQIALEKPKQDSMTLGELVKARMDEMDATPAPFVKDENSKPQKIAEPFSSFRQTGESMADYIDRLNTGWRGDLL